MQSKPKVVFVAGARPNFVKIAPLMRETRTHPELEAVLVHTGQHYDDRMSGIFFEELKISPPEINLGVGSGTHAEQLARIMIAMESLLKKLRPAMLVVVGDVNSTVAGTIVASRLNIPVAHVEAGLRSLDRTMPEEINRLLTDAIATWHFVSEPAGVANLQREGVAGERIHLVGNVMIDTLVTHLDEARRRNTAEALGFRAKQYALVTIHRPANVDQHKQALELIDCLAATSRFYPLLVPLHPRTRQSFERLGLLEKLANLPGARLVEPLGYLDFLSLQSDARLVLTDSGGIQEETTYLRVPCLTMRTNTERPITVERGTNTLVGADSAVLGQALERIASGRYKSGEVPALWDGRTAARIVAILDEALQKL